MLCSPGNAVRPPVLELEWFCQLDEALLPSLQERLLLPDVEVVLAPPVGPLDAPLKRNLCLITFESDGLFLNDRLVTQVS